MKMMKGFSPLDPHGACCNTTVEKKSTLSHTDTNLFFRKVMYEEI